MNIASISSTSLIWLLSEKIPMPMTLPIEEMERPQLNSPIPPRK